MPAPAQSFSAVTDSAVRVARELASAVARVPRASGAVVFVSGKLLGDLPALCRELAPALEGVPAVVAGAAGVLTESAEIESQSAASGIVWAGGSVEPVVAKGPTPEEVGDSLAKQLVDRVARSEAPALVFFGSERFGPHVLEPLSEARGLCNVFGAGTVGSPGSAVIAADGSVDSGGATAMILRGLSAPILRASPACRLLTPLRRITETRGSMVLGIDGEPALDVLSAVGEEFSSDSLVFAVLAEPEDQEAERPELSVRGVQGVDPVRRGLLISDEVRKGMLMAFAIRDGSAARTDLERSLRDARRDLAGGIPRFGLYLNCAGRGASLYGMPDVDVHAIRSRFPDLPLAGMFSSFEIAPRHGRPSLQLYTGVLALFTAPS
jgi:small ligand-binding sensory domain FIST